MPERYAVIIGSGFGELGAGKPQPVEENRFGRPSAPIRHINVADTAVMTLSRHGDEHTIPPHAVNYRANLLALLDGGVTDVIALCTVGLVTDRCAPGEVAVPDQLIDYTWGREHTVFDGGDGVVDHIEFTVPFSQTLREKLLAAATSAGVGCADGGVYAATQGPRLETAAEVDRLERDGADYVGMTAMPEAAIACELGLRYACFALGVNRAAGRGDVPIHSDLEASTGIAREAAKSVLHHFFTGQN
ncbi:MAG: S-methyl-5'-thioinosine phosphorylase [Pseudomonadota bacterium]